MNLTDRRVNIDSRAAFVAYVEPTQPDLEDTPMSTLRIIAPALCLAVAFGAGIARVDAATPTAASPAPSTAGSPWSGGRHFRHDEFRDVLRQLDLTADQKTQIKSVLAQAKPQWQVLGASMRDNRDALAATAPTDSAYASLLATAKANAASRIQVASEIKAQIYAILTPAQLARIPGIVAADQAARAARMAAWRAEHAPT
jgi:protein CpxP